MALLAINGLMLLGGLIALILFLRSKKNDRATRWGRDMCANKSVYGSLLTCNATAGPSRSPKSSLMLYPRTKTRNATATRTYQPRICLRIVVRHRVARIMIALAARRPTRLLSCLLASLLCKLLSDRLRFNLLHDMTLRPDDTWMIPA